MCGIIAVVRRTPNRTPPTSREILDLIASGVERADGRDAATPGPGLHAACEPLERADQLLRGVPGVLALLADPALVPGLQRFLADLNRQIRAVEHDLDQGATSAAAPDSAALEHANAGLVRLKDVVWSLERDRLRTAQAVADLGGASALGSPAAIAAYTSIQVALSALDRLEVRGRDSAGLHVMVSGHDLDLGSPEVSALIGSRDGDPLFRSRAVRVVDHQLSFVYKAAAEIGELGDNTRVLREAITADELLRRALAAPTAEAMVLGHTRWASVGIISEANAHPLNSEEDETRGGAGPYVIGALNGDVDNHADLRLEDELQIRPEITTDAKVIPTMVSRRVSQGQPAVEAFRETVARFEGSVAIAAEVAGDGSQIMLALRGSGQALYVGLAEDAFVVASEPYGLVEETSRYLRLDGETPADPENPAGSRGQIVALDPTRAGAIDGIRRLAYDGTELPVTDDEIHTAQITTRDIDRGDAPHFLLKEIGESPSSFRKTLRGRLVERDGRLDVHLGPESLPANVVEHLQSGAINRVIVIGQGTAAVAAQSLAQVLESLTSESPLRVTTAPATELSGFGLRPDMSDTLVIAISQSGTTTDTNRTVDLVRSRGAAVIAIVNRRNSDLTDRADGVLYTSDGRDVEMAVPSTKAFYAQIAAGVLLACAVAEHVPASPAEGAGGADGPPQALLQALRALPDQMAEVLEQRPAIAAIAHEHAPSRRYWAVVGNGANRIAAMELRIKLSELCYKSIAFDITEDKKHIDLSSEPLILVCAAGLTGSNVDDVAKEVAIYRAHKAAPIVIASAGERRFDAALGVIEVPSTIPELAFVLSAMAGHLFGYEAAVTIDGQAIPLREARAAIEGLVSRVSTVTADGEVLLRRLATDIQPAASRFFDGLRTGTYNGHLEASTAVRLTSLLRYALGISPLDAYQVEHGKIGTPGVVIEDLTTALSSGIDELTRPVDAIKHQAKTVTVGISRTDETLLQVRLVQKLLAVGTPRDRLTYRALRTLAALDAAVAEVTGSIRYQIDGDPVEGDASIAIVDRTGVAAQLRSRTETNAQLRGTKHSLAVEREVLAFRGRSDNRTLIGVPEVKDNHTSGLTLLHVRFHDRLPAGNAKAVLQGYRGRYAELKDAVTETEPEFDEALLGEIDVAELLTEPVHQLADRWRASS